MVTLLFSCKKDEFIHIPDNTAPPDTTIAQITIENYVNRCYIGLLGRKADNTEFSLAVGQLSTAKFTISSRQSFVDGITSKTDYSWNLFNLGKSKYLSGLDTADVNETIFLFDILLNDPGYQAIWPYLQTERAKLVLFLDIPGDLIAGNLSVKDMQRRMIYNYAYDQINMGTQNFVVSLFQHFLSRYPTADELSNSEKMVDGIPALVFLGQGKSKDDFLDIFFSSTDYYEGQVREVFNRFLYREPGATEEQSLSNEYRNTSNFKNLLKTVLSSDEYAGIE